MLSVIVPGPTVQPLVKGGITEMILTTEIDKWHKQYMKTSNIFAAIFFVFYFSILIGNLFCVKYFDVNNWSVPHQAVYGLMFFSFLLSGFLFLYLLRHFLSQRYGLVCPECKRPIVGVMNGAITVEHSRCPNCEQKIVEGDYTAIIPDKGFHINRKVNKLKLSLVILICFVILIQAIVSLEITFNIDIAGGITGVVSVLFMSIIFRIANSGKIKWILKKDIPH